MDKKESIAFEQATAKAQKEGRRDLIHSAFPPQGTEQKATEGSQSVPPTKEDNTTDMYK